MPCESSARARSRLKIALISPKGPLYRHRGGIFGQSLRYMPLTLPTLAALVPRDIPVELECIDEGIADVDPDLDADLVGMTVITGSAKRAYELSARFRARGVPVVLGGPHVTLAPEDAAPHADSVVVGYAEESWPQLLRDFRRGEMKARYDQRPDLDLAISPLPDRSVLPRFRYITADVFEATRGCVHSCDFCVVPAAWGRKPYQKPVEHIVADIERRGARRALFVDLNLIADREYAARLFEALIPLKIRWFGLATTRLADDRHLLDLAARSGCQGLLMGLETINRRALKQARKGFNDPERYAEIVERLHERGIALQGTFVFGLDEDTPEVFERTAEFAIDAKIDLPRFAIVTPFPGTALFRRLEREGRILTRDWDLYDGQRAVFQPARMRAEELEAGNERAWKIAYSARGIWRRIRHSPTPLVSAITNAGYRRYAHNLHRFYNCDAPTLPAAPRPPWRRAS